MDLFEAGAVACESDIVSKGARLGRYGIEKSYMHSRFKRHNLIQRDVIPTDFNLWTSFVEYVRRLAVVPQPAAASRHLRSSSFSFAAFVERFFPLTGS